MAEENVETRPYPNEHSARLINPPSNYIRVRRTNGSGDGNVQGVKIPTSIAVIWYIVKKDGKEVPIAQSLRFPTKNWTEAKAKKWLKDKEIKYKSFEAAKSSKSGLKDETERRILPVEDIELRIDDEEKPKLIGYAAKTGIFADLGWFREKIKPGAFSDVLEDDVRCLKNHDPNLILGRTTNETLRMKENTVGLHYEDDLPDTNVGRDIREEVRRKDITGCSFAFRVAEDEWKYFEDERVPERTIIKLKRLFDVGPVTYPAYSDTTVAARSNDTTVAARSFDRFKAEHEVQEEGEEKDIENVSEHEKTGSDSENKEEKSKNENKDEISSERKREIEKRLRKAERIINRCKKSAEI